MMVTLSPASRMFRGKFMEMLKEAGLADQVDKAVWKKDWVIDSQAVGDGQSSLIYLAPYVQRVALSDKKIVHADEKKVVFKYKKTEKESTRRERTMELEPMEFLHRFLQQRRSLGLNATSLLPNGFMKIRYYRPRSGFIYVASSMWLRHHPNSRYNIQDIREQISILASVIKDMLDETPGEIANYPWIVRKSIKPFSCRDKECGGMMVMVEYYYMPYQHVMLRRSPKINGDPADLGGEPQELAK